MENILDEILPFVTKPARYTGGEYNAIVKDLPSDGIRVALAFPDIYEIGMSNLGLRILYHIINKRPDAMAERVFAPWVDMEAEMRRRNLPLFSLETHTPLSEFDIIGFSLGYELTYTNVLNMLDLAGIPVLSSQRGKDHPLVIAGGCCTVNPEPMTDFIDAFVVGEGEEVIHEIIDTYKQYKTESRELLLRRLAGIEGVYVPSLYQVFYNEDGTIARVEPIDESVPTAIRRRLVVNLDEAEYPVAPVMPFIDTVHDRIPLEIMRGCTRGCRFCQAGIIYRPVRERTYKKLLDLAEKLVSNTGYEEIALLSLSTSDYSHIEELVRELIARYEPKRVGISLPSIRADANCVELAHEIQKVRKSGLTLAPEAGTQHMRDVINKNVTEGDLLGAVEAAFRCGWKRVKLYFMVGLPGETDEDIVGIAALASKVANVGRKLGFKPAVNVSVACLVPKPHTPFQWRAQDTIEEMNRKQRVLREALRDRSVSLSWHDPKISHLEAVLARGDRRLAKAVLLAWQNGCKFDAWDEYLKFDVWIKSIFGAGLDPAFYANRQREYSEILPWDHIDCGVSKAFLIREDRRADSGQTTPDCRDGQCMGCGVQRLLSNKRQVLVSAPCPAEAS
jgi:radical SAM family uncharacterized protein